MAEYTGRGVFRLGERVCIESRGSVAGSKEGEGPLGGGFDEVLEDSHLGCDTWEKAESRMQLHAASTAIRRAGLTKDDIDLIFAGDLNNQCIASAYGLRELGVPFLGLYAACSTMAEGILSAAVFVSSGAVRRAMAVTSSHFSTAERQFRFPLSYGGQRTPTSQWTCTAAGAVILSEEGKVRVAGGCIGTTADLGITDMTNMGAAMAPAAAETIRRYLTATETSPTDYDYIVTGDLGTVGSSLLPQILSEAGIDLADRHRDCGLMIFDAPPSGSDSQDTHCGGSGCGCSAAVLCSHFLPLLESGNAHRILFIATGALMSPMILQQGETIPSIAHLVELRA